MISRTKSRSSALPCPPDDDEEDGIVAAEDVWAVFMMTNFSTVDPDSQFASNLNFTKLHSIQYNLIFQFSTYHLMLLPNYPPFRIAVKVEKRFNAKLLFWLDDRRELFSFSLSSVFEIQRFESNWKTIKGRKWKI